MLILEQSLLRVPVESIRRTHRSITKLADKEFANVETGLRKTGSNASREEKLNAVEGALSKMKGMRRKVSSRKVG